MALYQNIVYQKEALKLEVIPDAEGDFPTEILEMGREFPVYRDQGGFYTMVPTIYGNQRASMGQWLMLEQGVAPEVPAVPAVDAIGSVTIGGVGAGDGVVGFSFKGVIYAISPEVGMTPEAIAEALAVILIAAENLLPTVNGATINLVAKPNKGHWYNKPLIDITTDTTLTLAPVGMDGGSFYVPSVPAHGEQYSIWNDDKFIITYELA